MFQQRWYERKDDFTEEEKKEAWDKTADVVKIYSDELVDRWNKEIDTLLVYAGLFSAVLTAFNVQSYTLLAPDPQDRLLDTLQQISAQLGSFSVNPSFVNSTSPAVSQIPVPPPQAPRSVVWLNTLWFSSLIFSLSAASIGIMVKQWLSEYSAGLSGSSRQTARLRQHRLNSLIKWRVGSVVAILPVLLQIALVLFFSGLLVLLWSLNDVVAGVASALIGVLFIATAGSIVLPTVKRDCSYISPLAFCFFVAALPLQRMWCNLRRSTALGIYALSQHASAPILKTALRRLDLWLCPKDGPPSPLWRGWEIRHVSKKSTSLDCDIITKAYTTTLNPVHLDVASPCLSALSPEEVLRCSKAVHEETVRHWKENEGDVQCMMPTHFWSDVWVALHIVSEYQRDEASSQSQHHASYYCCWGTNPRPNTSRFTSFTANIRSIVYSSSKALSMLRLLVLRLRVDEDVSRVIPGIRQSVALLAQQVFDAATAATAHRRPTADDINALHIALVLLLDCVAPDPAALEGDGKTTIQAIRTFTHHAISVFFEQFRTLVGDTNGRADRSDISVGWCYMRKFVNFLQRIQYQDEEFLSKLVGGLASLCAQRENIQRSLNLLCCLVHTPDILRPITRTRRSVALIAQQVFDAASTDRRPTEDKIWDLCAALDLLLACAAPDPAALEGDAKATIQAIRTSTHHAISVFFERFRTLVGDTKGEAKKSDVEKAWKSIDSFIYRLQRRRHQDDEFLPELLDGLEALIEQDVEVIERLHPYLCDHREWIREQKRGLDDRRKVCCLAPLCMSNDYE
ncbi:hypothetical protein C8Q76DRAFT_248362 [Earliella scabrosa]|nr:hypothetical protein C8Q76DRAFT_248362 [Earliella scabrosa]